VVPARPASGYDRPCRWVRSLLAACGGDLSAGMTDRVGLSMVRAWPAARHGGSCPRGDLNPTDRGSLTSQYARKSMTERSSRVLDVLQDSPIFPLLGLKAQRLSRSVSGPPPVRFGAGRWCRSVGPYRVGRWRATDSAPSRTVLQGRGEVCQAEGSRLRIATRIVLHQRGSGSPGLTVRGREVSPLCASSFLPSIVTAMFTAAYTDERVRFLDHPWAAEANGPRRCDEATLMHELSAFAGHRRSLGSEPWSYGREGMIDALGEGGRR
jgi:hypothetical protein